MLGLSRWLSDDESGIQRVLKFNSSIEFIKNVDVDQFKSIVIEKR